MFDIPNEDFECEFWVIISRFLEKHLYQVSKRNQSNYLEIYLTWCFQIQRSWHIHPKNKQFFMANWGKCIIFQWWFRIWIFFINYLKLHYLEIYSTCIFVQIQRSKNNLPLEKNWFFAKTLKQVCLISNVFHDILINRVRKPIYNQINKNKSSYIIIIYDLFNRISLSAITSWSLEFNVNLWITF